MLVRSNFQIIRKAFCSSSSVFNWNSGSEAIARKLWQKYTVDIDEGPRCDPRGMRPFELKKRLSGLEDFKGELSETNKYHPDIILAWQKMYDEFMNGNVKLPGRDPAGPLTFHKPSDKECVRLTYDKHGRVDH